MTYHCVNIKGSKENLNNFKHKAFLSENKAFCIKNIIASFFPDKIKDWFYKKYFSVASTSSELSLYSVFLPSFNDGNIEYYIQTDKADFEIDYIVKLFPYLEFQIHTIEELSSDVKVTYSSKNNSKLITFNININEFDIVTRPTSILALKELDYKLSWIKDNKPNIFKDILENQANISSNKIFIDFDKEHRLFYIQLHKFEIDNIYCNDEKYYRFTFPEYTNIDLENYWACFCIKHNFPLLLSDIELEDKLKNNWWGNLPEIWVDVLKESNQYTPNKDISEITELTFKSIMLDTLAPLKYLTNLKSLMLKDCFISDIRYLKYLSNLEYLDISNNSIFDLTPLNKLFNLKELKINSNSLEDISPITLLPNIINTEYLDLSNNCISSLKVILKFNNLRKLNISNNSFSCIAGIENLEKLKCINIKGNQIIDTKPLIALYEKTTGVNFDYIVAVNGVKEFYLNQIDIDNFNLNNLDWVKPYYRPKIR